MLMELYRTNSERNRLFKNLQDRKEFSGTLREATSIIRPKFIIESEDPLVRWNICWVEYFQRWYIIEDIRSIRNNLWELICVVDPLLTYRDDILKSTALLDSVAQVSGDSSLYTRAKNPYISSGKYVSSVKTSTKIIPFPTRLQDQGEWYLITAAGR